jgi:membrane associated rhomboid family serine protease
MSQYNFYQPFSGIIKHLIIINALMFFGTNLLLGEESNGYLGRLVLAAFMPGSEHFQPHQILTHMFMHGNLMHLLFNMMTLFFFGPMIEMIWGARKFLIYYLSCGLGSYFIYMGVQAWELTNQGINPTDWNTPMLGASGAIFGVLTAFAYLFPNNVISLIFPPISLKAKYFVPIMAVLELVYGVQGASTGIAHFAHLGGAITGFLILTSWYKLGRRR